MQHQVGVLHAVRGDVEELQDDRGSKRPAPRTPTPAAAPTEPPSSGRQKTKRRGGALSDAMNDALLSEALRARAESVRVVAAAAPRLLASQDAECQRRLLERQRAHDAAHGR